MTELNPLLQAALDYESFGWSVIPLAEGSKVPPKGFDVSKYRKKRATKAELRLWWSANPKYNVGILTGEASGLMVIDHDLYKDNYDHVKTLEYIPDDIVTPIVKTPREGQHQYFLCPDDATITIGADILPGVDYRCEGGYIVAPPSVNGNGKKYEWVIPPIDAMPIAPPPQFLKLIKNSNKYIDNKSTNFIYTRGVTKHKLDIVRDVKSCYIFSKMGSRDQDLFHVANMLSKGGASENEMSIILNILAEHCEPPFPESEIENKIGSAVKRAAKKSRNIAEEIREWSLLLNGTFSLQECYRELQLVTKEDQTTARVAIKRMEDDEIIEKHGEKRGHYRIKKIDAPDIDYMTNVDEYDIKFPLGIEDWVKINKSNIIVIAGESNSGKTAVCLNIALMNQSHKVNYLSSEMKDGTELRVRLDAFGIPLSSWDGIRFRYRTDNFPDIIEPDELNIVDYLDEGAEGEAYKMTRRIKDISDKLKNGVAVICIQKNSQKQFGFGGEGTKNAARLYMTITNQNRITIEKGKIWRNVNINPNGLYCDFKLVAGCKFMKTGSWEK